MRGRLGKEPVTEGIPAGSEGGNRGYAGKARQRRDWETPVWWVCMRERGW